MDCLPNRNPRTFRVRQHFDATRVADIPGEVCRRLADLGLGSRVRQGQSVAVTVGSRGIANLAEIVQAVVRFLRQLGVEPFLVPAMGSHGGGTAKGQRALIESYGVTEASAGCPIRSSMDTVVVCQAAEGFPIHFDRLAFEADHVLVLNRVKPHTNFVGEIESGLMKMLLIGLGKREGAAVYHRAILDYSFAQIIRSVAGEVLRRCHILAGLAVVENAYDQTACIEAVAPEEFEPREKELLKLAKRWMARLPFNDIDVLLIDRIGKDVSGTGLDTNVVGRKFNDHRAVDGETPRVKRICLRGLTPATHGNAVGLGIAEFCRSRLVRETDLAATRLNAMVANHVSAALMPIDYETDREMLEAALGTIGLTSPDNARLLWIADTLHLDEMECSTAYLAEAQARDTLEILTEPRPLPFDPGGNLPDDTV
ncbi:MAG: lactate racemase domain-containing protein [Thermoguttaceae bacterium]|nr:lactate racemase domain-containing protein [Thermoguttaceae bacterium]